MKWQEALLDGGGVEGELESGGYFPLNTGWSPKGCSCSTAVAISLDCIVFGAIAVTVASFFWLLHF